MLVTPQDSLYSGPIEQESQTAIDGLDLTTRVAAAALIALVATQWVFCVEVITLTTMLPPAIVIPTTMIGKTSLENRAKKKSAPMPDISPEQARREARDHTIREIQESAKSKEFFDRAEVLSHLSTISEISLYTLGAFAAIELLAGVNVMMLATMLPPAGALAVSLIAQEILSRAPKRKVVIIDQEGKITEHTPRVFEGPEEAWYREVKIIELLNAQDPDAILPTPSKKEQENDVLAAYTGKPQTVVNAHKRAKQLFAQSALKREAGKELVAQVKAKQAALKLAQEKEAHALRIRTGITDFLSSFDNNLDLKDNLSMFFQEIHSQVKEFYSGNNSFSITVNKASFKAYLQSGEQCDDTTVTLPEDGTLSFDVDTKTGRLQLVGSPITMTRAGKTINVTTLEYQDVENGALWRVPSHLAKTLPHNKWQLITNRHVLGQRISEQDSEFGESVEQLFGILLRLKTLKRFDVNGDKITLSFKEEKLDELLQYIHKKTEKQFFVKGQLEITIDVKARALIFSTPVAFDTSIGLNLKSLNCTGKGTWQFDVDYRRDTWKSKVLSKMFPLSKEKYNLLFTSFTQGFTPLSKPSQDGQ